MSSLHRVVFCFLFVLLRVEFKYRTSTVARILKTKRQGNLGLKMKVTLKVHVHYLVTLLNLVSSLTYSHFVHLEKWLCLFCSSIWIFQRLPNYSFGHIPMILSYQASCSDSSFMGLVKQWRFMFDHYPTKVVGTQDLLSTHQTTTIQIYHNQFATKTTHDLGN